MIAVEDIRSLLLSVLPLLASSLASLGQQSQSSLLHAYLSCAAALRHDTVHLQDILREHTAQELARSIHTLEKTLGFLELCLDDDLLVRRKQYPELVTDKFPKQSLIHAIVQQRQSEHSRPRDTFSNTTPDLSDLLGYVQVAARFSVENLDIEQARFSAHLDVLDQELENTQIDPANLPPKHTSQWRAPAPPRNIRENVLALYAGLSDCFKRSSTQHEHLENERGVLEAKLCLCLHCFASDEEGVTFELRVSSIRNVWTFCRICVLPESTFNATSTKRPWSYVDVCWYLEHSDANEKPLHFTFNGTKFQQTPESLANIRNAQTPDVSLIQNAFNYDHAGPLSLLSKRVLMARLAWVATQLFDSPWLPRNWTARFNSIPVDFAIATSQVGTGGDSPVERPRNREFESLHPNTLVLQLGIAIMKIEMGKALDMKRENSASDLENKNGTSDLDWLWADNEYQRIKHHFYGPIRAVVELCLYPARSDSAYLLKRLKFDSPIVSSSLHLDILVALEAELALVKGRRESWPPEDKTQMLGIHFQAYLKREVRPSASFNAPSESRNFQRAAQQRTSGSTDERSPPLPPLLPSPDASALHPEVTSWFRDYDEAILRRLDTNPTTRPVRIAILDSGIEEGNLHAPEFIEALDFSSRGVAKGVQDKHEHRHGTHVAALVGKTAPFADIYIAKVGNGEPVEADFVKAFNHAIDVWNVDIITMSFGYPNRASLSNFEDKALPKARDSATKKVLLFAAASNDGIARKGAFPARFPGVFCIFASDAAGNRWKYNPNPVPDEKNFSIIGKDVLGASSDRLEGTSFATPIAAGLAASLIEYVRQKWHNAHGVTKEQALKRLQSYSEMRKAFSIMSEKRDLYDVLMPWLGLFEKGDNDDEICKKLAKALNG